MTFRRNPHPARLRRVAELQTNMKTNHRLRRALMSPLRPGDIEKLVARRLIAFPAKTPDAYRTLRREAARIGMQKLRDRKKQNVSSA